MVPIAFAVHEFVFIRKPCRQNRPPKKTPTMVKIISRQWAIGARRQWNPRTANNNATKKQAHNFNNRRLQQVNTRHLRSKDNSNTCVHGGSRELDCAICHMEYYNEGQRSAVFIQTFCCIAYTYGHKAGCNSSIAPSSNWPSGNILTKR